MKRILSFLLVGMTFANDLFAVLDFDPETKYRMECKIFPGGSVALGELHGSSAYLYYVNGDVSSADAWWYIRKEAKGYTFTNAVTGQYITYNSERIPGVAKGLILTTNVSADASSYWDIESINGQFIIRSKERTEQVFNLRRDKTNLLGTYEGWGDVNELFTFYDEEGNVITDEDEQPGEVPDEFHEAFDSLRLGNKQLIYDKLNHRYLLPLNIALRKGGDLSEVFTYKLKKGYENHTVKIDGQIPDAQTGLVTLDDVNCERDYRLSLCDSTDTEVMNSHLRFTFLPVVEINVPSCNGSVYTTGTIRVTNSNLVGHDSTFVAAYKYRGATAQGFEKKAYAIKLLDKAGNSVDRSFFGLREDNKWILDAMAVDPACMRNRLSTDLWNDFSTPPYYKDREPKARTGTRGQFVEVLLNGNYHGMYCMTERLDRKQLKLKKHIPAEKSETGKEVIRGLLYKSSQWSYEVFMGHDLDRSEYPKKSPQPYTNRLGQENWSTFEFKYPDYEEEAVEWKPLWEAVNFVATSEDDYFDRDVKKYFDYPVLQDYYLFLDLLLATDNHGKNMFYYVYDTTGPEGNRLSIAPWDLDGVWGARWDGSTRITRANQDFDQFIWKHEHGQLTLFDRLKKSNTIAWQDELADRYAALRTTYFNEAKLVDRITQYEELFTESQADLREEKRWQKYHDNISEATAYMKEWIKDRIATLDAKYGYDPIVSSLNAVKADQYFRVQGDKGCICITSGEIRPVRVYSVNGTLLRQITLKQGFQVLNGFEPGIYILEGEKVVVK